MDAKLAAIIVHDIKNSLGVLEVQLRMLATDIDDERTHQAHVNCLALQEKLIGFLTLYKASSQGLIAQVEALSPLDFLQGLLRHQMHSPGSITVSIDETDMPLIAFFDENLVGLALEAALQNATRFARSKIVLSCHKRDSGIVFTVRDDGPGIGAQEAKPSTGLGMDLCRAIADAHIKGAQRGTVALANHPEGGAQFELILP